MKVYIARYHDGPHQEVVCVARKRKALRKALEQDWRAGGHAERPLVWLSTSWAPLMRTTSGGLTPAPYIIDRVVVL